MTVVVIDHHEPAFDENGNDILPEADAIVDPKQKSCPYPFKMLCAGGICYKLALLFLKRQNIQNDVLEQECLHMATLATVCDIVDLMEENRIIVKKGLNTMAQTTNAGLKALLAQTNLCGKQLTEYHIGFIIGPCVNAAGRLETAKTAVALFCETDEKKAQEYATYLAEQNNSRKDMTKKATEQIIKEIEQKNNLNEKVFVLYQQNVHESIAGIVALLIYIVLTIAGSGNVFLVVRVITATIALTAYAVKCGAEIVSDEKFGNSIFLMCICVLDIILSAAQMI